VILGNINETCPEERHHAFVQIGKLIVSPLPLVVPSLFCCRKLCQIGSQERGALRYAKSLATESLKFSEEP
jgi:hypothetical protein